MWETHGAEKRWKRISRGPFLERLHGRSSSSAQRTASVGVRVCGRLMDRQLALKELESFFIFSQVLVYNMPMEKSSRDSIDVCWPTLQPSLFILTLKNK
jgi:hypothetical protein